MRFHRNAAEPTLFVLSTNGSTLAAVAIVVGVARFDLMRPVDHPLTPKVHSLGDRIS